MGFKARVRIQTQHRIFGLQVGLHSNAVLVGGKLGARKKPAKARTATGIVRLQDQEFGFRCIHRRGNDEKVPPGKKGWKKDEKGQTGQQKRQFPTTTAGDVALDLGDFLDAPFRRAQPG